MAQPYVGEIRMFAGNFAPAGWLFCQGQLLPISEYETLFNLLGTTYGGDGQINFQLPNLQGRAAMHMGAGPGLPVANLAEIGGAETITLTTQQIPSHPHAMLGTNSTPQKSPSNAIPAIASSQITGLGTYQPSGGTIVTLKPNMIQNNSGNQPHENRQPYLCVSFIISPFGIFPSQT